MTPPLSGSSMGRGPASILLALAFYGLLAMGAWGAPQGVTMKASTVFNEYARDGQAVPVVVTLQNNGPAVTVTVTATVIAQDVNGAASQVVHLPAQSPEKSVTLAVDSYRGHLLNVTVTLTAGEGNLLEQPLNLRPVGAQDIVIAVVGKTQAGFDYLSGLRWPWGSRRDVFVTYLDPDRLPTLWAAYGVPTLVILDGITAQDLNDAQTQALQDWVWNGGTLVATSNLDPKQFDQPEWTGFLPATDLAFTTAPLVPDLSAFFNQTVARRGRSAPRISLPDPGPIPMVLGRPAAGADALMQIGGIGSTGGSGAQTLVARARRGFGLVYFLGLDPLRPPLADWRGTEALWGCLFADAQSAADPGRPAMDNLLSDPPELSTPSFGLMGIVLIVYILLVGPANFAWLKKKNLLPWLVVTVPGLALIFTTGIYTVGYLMKGSSTLYRQVTVAYCFSGQKASPMTTTFSLFSPERASYSFRIADPQAQGREAGNDAPHAGPVRDEDLSFQGESQEMWTMRRYTAETVAQLPGAVTLSVAEQGNRVTGTVASTLPYTINEARLVVGLRISDPFTVRPGQNSVDLPLSAPGGPDMLGSTLAQGWHLPAASKKFSLEQTGAQVGAALGNLLAVRSQAAPVLAGWTSQSLMPVTVRPGGLRSLSASILVVIGP